MNKYIFITPDDVERAKKVCEHHGGFSAHHLSNDHVTCIDGSVIFRISK